MIDKLRGIKHRYLGKKKSEYETEQERVLTLMQPFFDSKLESKSYWHKRNSLERYLSPKRIAFTQRLVDVLFETAVLSTDSTSTLMDVGCGSGYLLFLISEKCPKMSLAASDLNGSALDLVRGYVKNVEHTYNQNIYSLDTPAADIVVCTEVLEHLTEPKSALKRLLENVNSGGKLVITVPNGREDTSLAGEKSEDGMFWNGHVNFWSPESWEAFIREEVSGKNLTFFDVPDYGYSKNGVIIG